MTLPPHALTLPRRVRFGRGEAEAAIPEIIGGAARIALVHGRDPSRAAALKAGLEGAGVSVACAACPGEPTTDMLAGALDALRGHGAERVVAIGGGAALDLGKALAALLPAPHADPMRHLEVIGQGLPLDADPLPFIALPTTAGTGSEATRNAVIASPEHRRKVSLRDTRLVAELAVLDPALTDGAPKGVTMASGLDAVTQVIEPYLSRNANPFTDALCREAIPRGLRAMAALARGEDPGARDDILWVAHVSGIALANAGLGAVHGLAGVMGGETGEAHGAICGLLLPHILLANRAALPEGAPVAARFTEVEDWMRDALGVGFDGLAAWAKDAGLAPPAARLSAEARLSIAERSAASSSMKPNPVPLPAETLAQALADAGWG